MDPSEIVPAPTFVLDIAGELFTVLRFVSYKGNIAESEVYSEALRCVSECLSNPKLEIGEAALILKSQFEALNFDRLPREDLFNRRLTNYLTPPYSPRPRLTHKQTPTGLVKTMVNMPDRVHVTQKDLHLLSASCGYAPAVCRTGNSRYITEYADAFHGLVDARRDPNLNRIDYFSIYFRPLLNAWGSTMDPQFVAKINLWAKI